MRNEVNKYIGYISGVYPNVFTVNVEGDNKSFSYVDIIIKDITVEYI